MGGSLVILVDCSWRRTDRWQAEDSVCLLNRSWQGRQRTDRWEAGVDGDSATWGLRSLAPTMAKTAAAARSQGHGIGPGPRKERSRRAMETYAQGRGNCSVARYRGTVSLKRSVVGLAHLVLFRFVVSFPSMLTSQVRYAQQCTESSAPIPIK
jgi:hypothetical protein